MNFSSHNLAFSNAERKRLLIAKGEYFRDGIAEGSRTTQEGLHPNALVSDVWSHVVPALMSRFGGKLGATLAGVDIAAMLPLIMSGASALSKHVHFNRSMIKPALRGGIALGVIGAATAFFIRRKKAKAADLPPTA